MNAPNLLAPIWLITIAPEVPGNMEWIACLYETGSGIQIGPTTGLYEEGVHALARGTARAAERRPLG